MKSFGIYMVMGHKSHAKLDFALLVLYMLLEFLPITYGRLIEIGELY